VTETTQRAAFKQAVARLKEAGGETPILDARLLIQHALGIEWNQLFTGPDRDLTPEEAQKIEAVIGERLAGKPVSRIIGQRGFWKADFAINEHVLDPRPDTETVIMAVTRLLPDLGAPLSILDLGTGSGAILLALLHEYPAASGSGVDISSEAIHIARHNAERLDMTGRANFAVRDWNDGLAEIRGQFDVIVSNPPYIPSGDIPGLAPEVRQHDPLQALDGGPDGLTAYRALAKLIPGLLKPGGLVVLEMGIGQIEAVKKLFTDAGFGDFSSWKDLGGIDRALSMKEAR
jgi:release factor glutamine methyltransferase